jgi:hypothetical protein
MHGKQLGAFSATPKTGLSGGSAPAHAVAATHPFNPLRKGTSGKPEVNVIPAWSLRSAQTQERIGGVSKRGILRKQNSSNHPRIFSQC